MSGAINSLTMPKWGLSMTEGTVVEWLVEEGAEIAVGDEFAEVETDKMTSAVEAQEAGILRRKVAKVGDVVGVGGMLGVVASADASDEEIQAFVDTAPTPAPADEGAVETGPSSESVAGRLGPIHALVLGDGGEAVLLIHGFGGDALNWRFNMGELAETRTVIAVDLPGHGASTKNVGSGALDELVSSVVEVLDSTNVTRVHVVGHSLGGLVAAVLAAREPRVASLALIAPVGLGEEINAEFLDGYVSASSRREVKAVLRMLFADQNIVNRQLVEEVLRYKRLEGVPEALGALRDEIFRSGGPAASPSLDLTSLTVPVLVLWGAEDAVLAASATAGARAETIESAGHSPHIEAASEVNRLLADFLP